MIIGILSLSYMSRGGKPTNEMDVSGDVACIKHTCQEYQEYQGPERGIKLSPPLDGV